MHLLKNTKPISMLRHGILEPGEWLCEDINAAELMIMGERGTSTIEYRGDRQTNDGSAGGMLLVRSGAIGDLLYLSPAIRALQELNPDVRFGLSCFPKHHEVMCDLGVELLPYPLPLSEAVKFSHVITLENLIESQPTKHATDCFADALNVAVTDYRPIFNLNEFELAWGQNEFPRTKHMRVGIQCRANIANRDYPLQLWQRVIEELNMKHDCEVFLFGLKGQLPPAPGAPLVTNLTERDLTLRQSAAILATCDVFAGVDSAFMPLCHALGIPAVGLYAAFDWKTRTSKAPQTWALTGLGECAPCNWHRHAGKSFPPSQRCAKENYCNVLATIQPDRIVAKLMSLPRKIGRVTGCGMPSPSNDKRHFPCK